MHTAVERDDFVKINYKNIPFNARKNFEKYTISVSMFDTPYDYGSIMHYSSRAFAINRREPTIIALKPTDAEMGQREGNRKYLKIL